MMETEMAGRAARTNGDGDPCPPWCVVNHSYELIPGHPDNVHGAQMCTGIAFVRPVQLPSKDHAEVQICGFNRSAGNLYVDAEHAVYLAGLVDQLAAVTPEEHQQLAAMIRQAAAVIDDAGG